jgi:hypothetical protein
MTSNDGWVGCVWEVYSTRGPGADRLGPGKFSLSLTGTSSYIAKREDKNEKHRMPDWWDGLEFRVHGSQPPKAVSGLPRWLPKNDDLWTAAADTVRKASNFNTQYLASAIPKHDIFMIRCDNAVTDGTPLLILQIAAIGGPHPLQDGTAEGGHK